MASSIKKLTVFWWVQATCLLLIFGTTGCQINLSPTKPFSQSINDPFKFDPNRNYRILSVKLPGIPFENIKIDQQKRLIRILVPADFEGGELKPVVTLTENTTLLDGLGQRNPFRMESFCYCSQRELVTIGPSDKQGYYNPVQYGVVAEASAPLELKPTQTPLVVPLGAYMSFSIPVRNPYGNSPVTGAYVQRVNGGTPIIVQGAEYNTNANSCAFFRCDNKQPGHLAFTANLSNKPALEPGNYQLILEQQNGHRLSQPIQLIRGETSLDDNRFFGHTIMQGQSDMVLQGANLYVDEITGTITAPDGKSWSVRPITGAPNGTKLTLSMPIDLPLGHYQLQLFKNGTAFTDCRRLSVRQSDRHPVIYSLVYAINCLRTQPVPMQRGVKQSVVLSYYSVSASTMKLTSTTKPDESYRVSIVQPIESFPQITLPQTISAGTYRVTLLTEDRGQLYESEPFEQPVIVQ